MSDKEPTPEPKPPRTAARRSVPAKNAVIQAYKVCANITKACRAAKRDPKQHYRWMVTDPVYRAEFEAAMIECKAMWEQEAVERALRGRTRKIFYKGEPVIDPVTGKQYCEEQPSDALLMFMLKSFDPVRYRERYDLGGDVNVHHHIQHRKIEEALIALSQGDRTTTDRIIDDRIDGRVSVNGDIRRNGKSG